MYAVNLIKYLYGILRHCGVPFGLNNLIWQASVFIMSMLTELVSAWNANLNCVRCVIWLFPLLRVWSYCVMDAVMLLWIIASHHMSDEDPGLGRDISWKYWHCQGNSFRGFYGESTFKPLQWCTWGSTKFLTNYQH